jgi:hypothetical protein
MLQTNYQNDPVVEILRLAYRRGLAIQQEQEEKSKGINFQPLEGNLLPAKQGHSNSENEAKEEQAKVSK